MNELERNANSIIEFLKAEGYCVGSKNDLITALLIASIVDLKNAVLYGGK